MTDTVSRWRPEPDIISAHVVSVVFAAGSTAAKRTRIMHAAVWPHCTFIHCGYSIFQIIILQTKTAKRKVRKYFQTAADHTFTMCWKEEMAAF